LPLETNAIRDVVLIREEGGSRVYKLENGTKRWITNENAFNTNNFKWDEIAPINKTELNSWPEGPSIN